jgi:heme/copper-type cytochrome/quinol oxidase subunit 1
MRLDRVPFFSWSMLVAGTLWLVTLPVLGASLILAFLDHHYGRLEFGDPGALFGYVIWIFDQPAAYIAAIPALGVVAEIAPVVAGREQRRAGAQRGAIAAFGVLAFGAWAQPAISTEFTDSILYVGMAFAVAVPVLALAGGVMDTVRRGEMRWTGPFVLAGVALDLLLLAIILGAVLSIDSLDLLGTTWQTAQNDLIWMAAVAGGLAGLVWWAPKIWGRLLPASTGHLLAAVLGLGGLLVAIGLAVAGALDQPVATFAYDARDGVAALDVVALIGAAVVFLAPIIAVYGIARALSRRPDPAVDPADPWGGQTLEWSTPSPPPRGNFGDDIPVVTSAAPLFTDPGDAEDDEASA